jgi:hypothetical protein
MSCYVTSSWKIVIFGVRETRAGADGYAENVCGCASFFFYYEFSHYGYKDTQFFAFEKKVDGKVGLKMLSMKSRHQSALPARSLERKPSWSLEYAQHSV